MSNGMLGRSAIEIAEAVHTGATSARAVTEAHLAVIAERDPTVNAFQLVRTEAALREADAMDAGTDLARLPLAGVPIAIKDNVDVAGEPTRNGSRATDPAPRPADHEAVGRLRRAGAVIVGKTRVPEMCVWGHTDGDFGVVRNPWKLDRSPGGSSGGSGAAVAAGCVPIALGADGMGSTRIPAASCGIVGFKPGPGLVPADLGPSDWFGMAENGCLTTTVTDAAVMLAVLSGRHDLGDVGEPGSLRVAVSVKSPVAGVLVASAHRDAALGSAEVLAGLGHRVLRRTPPYTLRNALAMGARWGSGIAEDASGLDRKALQKRTRRHMRFGRALTRLGFLEGSGYERWSGAMERFFEEVDVLLTPSLARRPPRAKNRSRGSWIANLQVDANYAPFAAPWNFARLPAMSVPAGIGSDGLPLGVQLVAARGGESLLLALARQLEEVRPWPRQTPRPVPAKA